MKNTTPIYFDIHVMYSRSNGYSLPFKAESDELDDDYTDDDVIELAMSKNEIDKGDAIHVDMVNEIPEQEYYELKKV